MRVIAQTAVRVFFAAVLAAAAAVCWGSAASATTVAPNAAPQQSAIDQLVPSSSAVISSPSPEPPTPPADACTVTVGGEKKHGRSDGSSWCCVNKGTMHEQCWSCGTYTCSDGWNLIGPGGGDIKEFETI